MAELLTDRVESPSSMTKQHTDAPNNTDVAQTPDLCHKRFLLQTLSTTRLGPLAGEQQDAQQPQDRLQQARYV
jgi:hypothetical protein